MKGGGEEDLKLPFTTAIADQNSRDTSQIWMPRSLFSKLSAPGQKILPRECERPMGGLNKKFCRISQQIAKFGPEQLEEAGFCRLRYRLIPWPRNQFSSPGIEFFSSGETRKTFKKQWPEIQGQRLISSYV